MIRTDLAMEMSGTREKIPGITVEETLQGSVKCTRVTVSTFGAARAIGKPLGTYVTLEDAGLCLRENREEDFLVSSIARELALLLPGSGGETVLVIGLGNEDLTPDALGPRVIKKVCVTRPFADKELPSVCVLAPGVTGQTGMETEEIIKGVVAQVHPSVVLVLDALCARSVERLMTTVQLSDAGVVPGSGVGNRRCAINAETLGIPVLAIGVPMVVHASTIVEDALEKLFPERPEAAERMYRRLDAHKLVVTPAAIDEAVEVVADRLAKAINAALFDSKKMAYSGKEAHRNGL